MNCKVKPCCAALAARKLAERDPAIVEITRGGKNKSHHVLRKSDMKLHDPVTMLPDAHIQGKTRALAHLAPAHPHAIASSRHVMTLS